MKTLSLALILLISCFVFGQTAVEPSNFREPNAGTASNPYKIASLENLYWITRNTTRLNKYYEQTANINASVTRIWIGNGGWFPIGNSNTQFTGSFNGNGYTIDSLYLNRATTDNQGLFGVASTGTIMNVGVTNVNVTGRAGVAGLVGYSYYSTVTGCFTKGTVNGTSHTGGLVGWNFHSTVSNSYSSCSVNGYDYTGGLIGNNENSTISFCYSRGLVSSESSWRGSLVGYNHLSDVINCLWSKTITPDLDNGIGTGITTIEMRTRSTYLTAGWDFMNETENGSNDYWGMDETGAKNEGYPFLKCQGYSDLRITDKTPFLIKSLDDLKYLSENTALWDKAIKQTADINASATKYWYDGAGWKIIGNHILRFSGKYDGQGYYIDSLFLDSPTENTGLFGIIIQASIKNIKLTNVNITGLITGGLAGTSSNSSIINCSVSGTIRGEKQTGILIGSSTGTTIINCSGSGSVVGEDYATGGLIGESSYSSINNSYSIGNVNGNDMTGGIVGMNEGNLTSCYSSSIVNGNNQVGGLIGSGTGLVINCYSNSSVNGNNQVGGLVGAGSYLDINTSYSSGSIIGVNQVGGLIGETESSNITNCYSYSSVNGMSIVGGVAGENLSSKISYCYSSGKVSSDSSVSENVGGIAGVSGGKINYCFWNKTINPELDNGIGTGINTLEMRTHDTYLTAGWDFVNETDNGLDDYWGMNETGAENNGYPFLQWQGYSDLVITDETPLLIKSLDDLKYLSDFPALWNKNIRQTANINASETKLWYEGAWKTIGDRLLPFTGKYDGQGYSIDSLYIKYPTDYGGAVWFD